MKVREAITSCLPNNSLKILVPVLEKFVVCAKFLNCQELSCTKFERYTSYHFGESIVSHVLRLYSYSLWCLRLENFFFWHLNRFCGVFPFSAAPDIWYLSVSDSDCFELNMIIYPPCTLADISSAAQHDDTGDTFIRHWSHRKMQTIIEVRRGPLYRLTGLFAAKAHTGVARHLAGAR